MDRREAARDECIGCPECGQMVECGSNWADGRDPFASCPDCGPVDLNAEEGYTIGEPVVIVATGASATVVDFGPAMNYNPVPSYLVRVGHASVWKTADELTSH